MNVIRKVLVALAAIGMVVGIVVGMEADGTCGEGVDSAMPALVAFAVGDVVTIENVGTANSVDFGGARIMAGSEQLGILPYTTVLAPNPFIYTKYIPMAPKWFQKVKISRPLVAGEKFTVTNGVGIYVTGKGL